jgi:hypothetical protein
MYALPICGTFNGVKKTASANTVITMVIPPFGGGNAPPKLYKVSPAGTTASTTVQTDAQPNWTTPADAFTHITDLIYTSLSTVHQVYFLRPLNWTFQMSEMTSSSTTMALAADPGTWATAGVYKYGAAGGASVVPSQANNVIAANDYVTYQLNDGRWIVDTITSGTGTTPVLTTGVPAVTGTKLLAGSPVFFYGIQTDTDPATGMVQPLMDTVANTRLVVSAYGPQIWSAVHRGDPLIFYSSNGTDAGLVQVIGASYANLW